jgi:hypothetical protein
MTACTPGSRSAPETSIETMRAWACGLRRMAPASSPDIVRSAAYVVFPATFCGASSFGRRRPTTRSASAGSTIDSSSAAMVRLLDLARRVPAHVQTYTPSSRATLLG